MLGETYKEEVGIVGATLVPRAGTHMGVGVPHVGKAHIWQAKIQPSSSLRNLGYVK